MFGVDVIFADHHEPHSEGIPNEYAVINPKIYDSNYPFKDTAVCVVVLKMMQVLLITFSEKYNQKTCFVLC